MRERRLILIVGFALLALAARPVRAQGDQSDVISAQGDALSRASSAPALVPAMPTVPPNSAPPVVPKTAGTAAIRPGGGPEAGNMALGQQAPQPGNAPQPPAMPPGTLANSAPAQAAASPVPGTVPGEPQPPGKGRTAALIVTGALIALALFLWERRR